MRHSLMDSVARSSLATGLATACGLIVLTAAAYWPAMQAGEIWDDNLYVTDNATLRADDALRRIWFELEGSPQYYPLLFTTFWIQHRLTGLDPALSHVINVVLHALSAVVIWRTLRRLAVPGAGFCAAVFAVHPVTVESVAWISERKNTLSMLLAAFSVFAVLRFWDAPRPGARRWCWYATAAVAFTAALLAKTAVVGMLGGLLVLMWWRRRRVSRADLLLAVALGVVTVALGSITVFQEATYGVGNTVPRPEGFASRLAASGWCVWFYLYKILVPARLALIYPRWSVDPAGPATWLPLVALLAALAVTWRYRNGWGRPALTTLLFCVILLLPTLGVFDTSYFAHSLVADHFLYFALIAPICLAAAAALRLGGLFRPSPATGVVLVTAGVLAVLSTLTWHRSRLYADPAKLWLDTVRMNPAALAAHVNLAIALESQGRLDEAIGHHRVALQIKPDSAEAHINLAQALASHGRLDEAVGHYRVALQIKPDIAEAHFDLGTALQSQGRLDEAIGHYRTAVQIKPDSAEAHFNLAHALASQDRLDEAIGHYRAALQIKPDNVNAHNNLGSALASQGRLDEAVVHYRVAIQLKPDYARAHNNLGKALASQGRLDEAARHFRRVLRIRPDHAQAHSNLGSILGRLGRLNEAVVHFREALSLDPGLTTTRASLDHILEMQDQAKP